MKPEEIEKIEQLKKNIKNLREIEDILYNKLIKSLELRPEEENYLFDYIYNENKLTYEEYMTKYGIK